jgi:hypothetical protein
LRDGQLFGLLLYGRGGMGVFGGGLFDYARKGERGQNIDCGF